MGNRAVITFKSHPKIGIYLHWNGGVESVLAFIEATKRRNARAPGDCYSVARLVQTIGDFLGHDGLSLGVDAIDSLDCDNGNNGTFVIANDWSIAERLYTEATARTLEDLSAIETARYDSMVKMMDELQAAREGFSQ